MTFAEESRALLGGAWAALGGEAALLDLVDMTGDGERLLPSTLPALPTMVAAVAASTLAAAVLDGARLARPPERVEVDAEHVAVAACSERFAHEEGSAGTALFAPLSRFWRTADGWLRLHANYAWHRERALTVLGCENRPEAVERAIRTWHGEELEDALAAAGAVGYMVRGRAEWEAHPQGRACAALPLLTSVAVSGARPGRRAGVGRAAVGLRVLDLTRVIAGPVATRTLAGWGADVLRLDSPRLPEIPTQALDTLMGKRSALLDISQPSGRGRVEDLLAEADVLVQGYRPGALARYGLSHDELAERHPHLSVVTLSAWGPSGPWAARRGFDSMVQCPTGIALAEGTDGEPGALPAQILDHATGYLAAAAAMLALARVERGDPPRSMRLSLAQTAHWLMSGGTRSRPASRDLHPDDHWIRLLGAGRPVSVIGPPGLVGDLLPSWTATTVLGADPPSFVHQR